MNEIGFPGLGLQFTLNPVAFTIFSKDIYWYGIIIAIGLGLALWYGVKEAKRTNFPSDALIDAVLYGTIAAIICARAYYVLFKWDYYQNNLSEIFMIWNGGIAIYGGIIGAFVSALIYCKIKNVSFLHLADIAAPAFLIGQSIGRWGNFVNAEAYGYETELPWRMQLYSSELSRIAAVHPTFLYESLWNAVGFLGLFLIRKKSPYHGFVFFLYLVWYGMGRVWIEGLRTDSLYLGNMRISQLVAGLCIVLGTILIIWGFSNKNRQELV